MIFKKTTLLVILIYSTSAISQEFDPKFLESLPEEVRNDLLLEVENQTKTEEQQYRRPSTFIEKPQETSDRFGLNIFSMMQSTLMPINEPNFDSNYLLDFGDVLQLQLIAESSIKSHSNYSCSKKYNSNNDYNYNHNDNNDDHYYYHAYNFHYSDYYHDYNHHDYYYIDYYA